VGTYTLNFNLYRPDPSESVDVDSQVNRNLDIIDVEAKPLFEWQPFFGPSISTDVTLVKKKGYRFYKRYSNSLRYWDPVAFNAPQDPDASVTAWESLAPYIAALYTGVGGTTDPSWPNSRSVVRGTGAVDITFTGKIKLSTGAEMPLDTSTTILNLPTAMRPVAHKSFLTAGPGPSSSTATYSIARIDINTSGVVTFRRMGDPAPLVTNLHYVSLDGVNYSTEVAQ
jgi:hypothetical protein